MALTGGSWPNLNDIIKRTAPDGSIETKIAMLLSQQNDVLMDAPVMEANQLLGHRETVQTALPNTYLRRFNKGTPRSKGSTAQVTDNIAMYEARSAIDMKLARLNSFSASWRFTEEAGFIEAMGQGLARDIFYGNNVDDPDAMTGFAARYNSLTGPQKDQIIDCGGTGSTNTSIWLICWDDDTMNLRYPKGLTADKIVTAQDLGQKTVNDSDGNPFEALETLYETNLGLSIKDYRYAVRLCNIDVTQLKSDGSTLDLWNKLIEATERLQSTSKGRCYIYMNRTVRTALRLQASNKKNVRLDRMEVDGKMLEGMDGIPFRRVDALLNTEERVV